ncbi:hypothetical protein UFOVP116_170 [uncultured Caudovirales phage]|uniref:Uncharacterized protein n=1 Tax=uncultured Caudovirales phage TaxID=2100421 RepID=A0A6J5L692_9CAUD|nr:hypothetical protein UFOVP116_170 [uncultured Caudovirales phage]
MNKRIQQLVGQAGFHPNLNWDHTDWHAAGHSNLFEKFAVLIVRECADIARNTDLEDVEGGDGAVLHAAGLQIEQHFGVE